MELKRSRICGVAFAIVVLSTWSSLPVGAQSPPAERQVDEIVLKIGDRTVRRSEIRDQLAFEPPELVGRLNDDSNFARIYAVRWYQAELFSRAAADDGVLKRVPGLEGAAGNLGRNLIADEYTKQMMAVDFKPTDNEIQSFYSLNKELCTPPARLHLARLGVQIAKNASEDEVAGAKKRLEKMQARIKAGDSFAAIADEMSDLPAKEGGGDVGWIAEKELGEEEGAETIRKLTVGETSQPIRTRRGWEIFKLVEKETGKTKSLADCRSEIVQQINTQYRKATTQTRSDELARRYNASLNLDAFLAALAAVPAPQPADASSGAAGGGN